MVFRPTITDPDLPHQVVLNFGNGDGVVWVTCNCRVRYGRKPMGRSPDYPNTAKLYNDPTNHAEPFRRTDRIRIG